MTGYVGIGVHPCLSPWKWSPQNPLPFHGSKPPLDPMGSYLFPLQTTIHSWNLEGWGGVDSKTKCVISCVPMFFSTFFDGVKNVHHSPIWGIKNDFKVQPPCFLLGFCTPNCGHKNRKVYGAIKKLEEVEFWEGKLLPDQELKVQRIILFFRIAFQTWFQFVSKKFWEWPAGKSSRFLSDKRGRLANARGCPVGFKLGGATGEIPSISESYCWWKKSCTR